MKAVLHIKPRLDHQARYGAAMQAGLERHGITVLQGHPDQPEPCDFAVMWGWKQPNVVKAAPHVLVMEATHLREGQPGNLTAASCGWDGLARRGRYPVAVDGGERWRARHGHLMQPWTERTGRALLIGQVTGDASIGTLDVDRWAAFMCEEMRRRGWGVVYRPHPFASHGRLLPGAHRPAGTLAQDLAAAGVCVTFSSTAGVEAVLAGVPTITIDEGAMAWPVASHALDAPLVRPDREAWAHDLAWTSWTLEEIRSGEAWAHLAPIMEPGTWR